MRELDTWSGRDLFGKTAYALFMIWNVLGTAFGVLAGFVIVFGSIGAWLSSEIVTVAGSEQLVAIPAMTFVVIGIVIFVWALGALPLGVLAYVTRPEYGGAALVELREQNILLREVLQLMASPSTTRPPGR
ncbi:hypothetical protein RA307_30620 [Xanthobacteraceae bacterium Astr-EGSB]|uniref:hypothetical protein n=1 Tax=Astrobacterium formosum TaxID=3069710 RepID=UPI0027AF6FBB|nr:hypothetical protein [Xanthobacteraceae bacterium Astr-EGSB]